MSAGRDLRAVKEYVVDMLGSVTGRKRTAALADDDGVRHLALLILILQQASGLLTAAMVGTDHPFWTVERDAGLHLPNLSHMKVNKEAVSAAQEASACIKLSEPSAKTSALATILSIGDKAEIFKS